jgi:multidrug efflux pump subunit AcrA (membrane-fusion protein)
MRYLNCSVILCLALSCSDVRKPTEQLTPLSVGNSIASRTIVETYTIAPKPFIYVVNANGKINSEHELVINAQTSGQLTICILKTNAYVTAGMVLLKLDDTHLQLRLTRAEQAKYNSQREYESMLLGYEHMLKEKQEKESSAIKLKLRIASGVSAQN